eukprot:XP_011435873.1 PREDICTED: uncharacterized protein LOC105334206 isoform X2 [Crassostrea gigas]
MNYQLYLAVLVLCCVSLCSSLDCKRNAKEKCQEDCHWIEINNTCIDCPLGFYGRHCSSQCRYPNFGKHCQQDCSHCEKEVCNASFGCLTKDKEETSPDSDLALVIGFSVGFGVVMVIAAFFIITITNRRFYTRHLRENAHYVGSVVTEHTISTNHRPLEQYTILCDNNEPTDGGIYMLASTLRYENVRV